MDRFARHLTSGYLKPFLDRNCGSSRCKILWDQAQCFKPSAAEQNQRIKKPHLQQQSSYQQNITEYLRYSSAVGLTFSDPKNAGGDIENGAGSAPAPYYLCLHLLPRCFSGVIHFTHSFQSHSRSCNSYVLIEHNLSPS